MKGCKRGPKSETGGGRWGIVGGVVVKYFPETVTFLCLLVFWWKYYSTEIKQDNEKNNSVRRPIALLHYL